MGEDIASQLKGLGVSGALQVGAALQGKADDYTNTSDVEYAWAIKCHKHAEIYMKILANQEPSKIKLTRIDNIIYKQFNRLFKNLQIDVINEDNFKTVTAKKKWRPFCEFFKDRVEDYNFGALLRIDCKKDFSEENSILVPRIQFLAVEIARNKSGLNDDIHAYLNDPQVLKDKVES